ncbi:MAG: hypothetical protein IKR83_06430 [Bacteroidales bacterium]|nr:hypothetical protein [Bacteroidales bacterium]
MKKILTVMMALVLTFGAQAQIGNLVGSAVKKGLQKGIEKKVEQKVDEALGTKNNQQQETVTPKQNDNNTVVSEEPGDHIPTPEEVMNMVPKIPTFQQLSEYLCEKNRENPRTLKLLANPTTTFLTQMTVAMANGYVATMASNGSIYTLDKQLMDDLGITEEQYNAMSEEEQQALARQYASELEERYRRTAEVLATDDIYIKLMDEYNAVGDKVDGMHKEAEEACARIWTDKYSKTNDICAYYREAVPIYYKAVMDGMDMRKKQQLTIAKKADERVQKLAKQHPHEVFSGFYNMGGLCATTYVSDAALLTNIPDPR